MNEPLQLDISGTEAKLVKAIENDELIVFYGAGVSKLAGCELWEDLAKCVVNAFPEEMIPKTHKEILCERAKNKPDYSLNYCFNILDQSSEKEKELYYYKPIIDSVTPTDLSKFKLVHDKIFNLAPLSFVTTNIDRGIEQISDKLSLQGKNIIDLTNITETNSEEIISLIRNGNVFYLHGQIDSKKDEFKNIKKTIFNTDDYFRFYNQPNIKRFLKEIFGGNFTVLFIGYGLGDREILSNLLNSEISSSKKFTKYYSLYPNKSDTEYEIDVGFYQSFSIKLLPYIIENGNWDKLLDTLDYLSYLTVKTKARKIEIYNAIEELKK